MSDRDDKLASIVRVMGLVQDDCRNDAMATDSTPFTPLGVGTQFGNLYAAVSACAQAIQVLAEQERAS